MVFQFGRIVFDVQVDGSDASTPVAPMDARIVIIGNFELFLRLPIMPLTYLVIFYHFLPQKYGFFMVITYRVIVHQSRGSAVNLLK